MPREPVQTGPTDHTVALNMRTFRDEQKLTVLDLAARIEQRTGSVYSRPSLTDIENGRRRVSAHDLLAIAAGLGVSVPSLLMPGRSEGWDMVETSASNRPVQAPTLERWLRRMGGQPGTVHLDEYGEMVKELAIFKMLTADLEARMRAQEQEQREQLEQGEES